MTTPGPSPDPERLRPLFEVPETDDWARCEIRERRELDRPLTTWVDETGNILAEPTGTAWWNLQLAERVSIGFDRSTGEVCDLDTWAATGSARRATWQLSADVRDGAVVALHDGDAGTIYDYLDGDDYYDPDAGIWWAGHAQEATVWVRIAASTLIGCREDSSRRARIVALALGVPKASATSDRRGAVPRTTGIGRGVEWVRSSGRS